MCVVTKNVCSHKMLVSIKNLFSSKKKSYSQYSQWANVFLDGTNYSIVICRPQVLMTKRAQACRLPNRNFRKSPPKFDSPNCINIEECLKKQEIKAGDNP